MKNLFKDGTIILSIIFTITLAGCASGTANEIETDNQALQDLNKNVNALFNKKQTDIKESLSEEKIQDQFNEVAQLTNQFESDSADAQVYDKIFTKMEDAYEMFYLEKDINYQIDRAEEDPSIVSYYTLEEFLEQVDPNYEDFHKRMEDKMAKLKEIVQ